MKKELLEALSKKWLMFSKLFHLARQKAKEKAEGNDITLEVDSHLPLPPIDPVLTH